jgi:hypothetical protein
VTLNPNADIKAAIGHQSKPKTNNNSLSKLREKSPAGLFGGEDDY